MMVSLIRMQSTLAATMRSPICGFLDLTNRLRGTASGGPTCCPERVSISGYSFSRGGVVLEGEAAVPHILWDSQSLSCLSCSTKFTNLPSRNVVLSI